MKLINHRNGNITKEGEFYYLEKNYKSYFELHRNEDTLQEKCEDNNFIVLESVLQICDNPFFELDKLYKKNASKIFFKNRLKLIHIT
jgi:hypothetical protein